MSPSRPSSLKRNQSGGSKPYARDIAPIAIPSPSDITLSDGTNPCAVSSTTTSFSGPDPPAHGQTQYPPVERPGFPTYAQYKQVELTYLQSLTPRRQGKALISQALFDRIWDVLHQPDSQGETAQFRFWARKMFTLSKTHRCAIGGANSNEGPREVLLHDNLLVAIQEQLYDLLCYCHGSTGHGGRDKTCALIRKYYTWVPKDLVSNFIKTCPTCIMKKCGNLDTAAFATPNKVEDPKVAMYGVKSEYTGPCTPVGLMTGSNVPWSHDISVSSKSDKTDPIEVAYREAVQRARGVKASLSGFSHHGSSHGLQGVPMTREVSLYKGLPNGWQYRYNDYASAYADFMQTKEQGVLQDGDLGVHAQRPRVPSILPFWSPDQFAQLRDCQPLQDTDLGSMPNMLSFSSPVIPLESGQSQDMDSLRHLLLAHPQEPEKDTIVKEESQQSFLRQLDPLLMHLSDSCQTPIKGDPTEQAAEVDLFSDTPTAIKRGTVRPHLHLDLPGNHSFQSSFVAYRGDLTEEPTSSDGAFIGMIWQPKGGSSPVSGDGSSFTMPPLSAATTVSAPNSALPTPVDEFACNASDYDPNGNEDDIKGKIKIEPDLEEIVLNEGIQVCGL